MTPAPVRTRACARPVAMFFPWTYRKGAWCPSCDHPHRVCVGFTLIRHRKVFVCEGCHYRTTDPSHVDALAASQPPEGVELHWSLDPQEVRHVA